MSSGWDAEWKHHDLSTPAVGALSLYAVEGLASLAHSYSGDIDALAAALGAANLGVTWLRDHHFWLRVYYTAATLVSLAWILYAEHTSPFTHIALTFFGIAAGAFALAYPVAAYVDRREKRETDERMAEWAKRQAIAGDWPGMFAALGIKGVTQEGDPVENRVGSTLTFRLPPTGRKTFGHVAGLSDQLEVMLNLPHRTLRFRRGVGAAEFHVDLRTRDVLSEVIPYEIEDEPVSVNDPFSIGLDEFGEDIMILLREITAMVFAPKRSGKSNLLWVILACLLRCVDVVIWFIDLKGGRTAKPWLQPWFEGRVDRPALDWVATTHEEALLMTGCLKMAIDHRATTGDGEKVVPSAQQPAILLISDETTSLVGLEAGRIGAMIRSLLNDIVGRGGSEAADTVLAFLRSTVSNLGTSDLKANAKLRITLGANSAADAVSATDNPGTGRAITEFKHKGSMFVEADKGDGSTGRSRRIEAEEIPDISYAYSQWRPELEPDLEAWLGDVYAQRWSPERAGHLLPQARQRELGISPAPSQTAPTTLAAPAAAPVRPVPSASLPTAPPPPTDVKPAYRTKDGRPIPRKLDEATVDEMFAGLRAELGDLSSGVHEGKERMLGIVRAAGPSGISPNELLGQLAAAGVAIGRQALHGWLNEAISNGTVRRLEGERGVYVAAEHA